MTGDYSSAMREAEEAAQGHVSKFIDALAERVGARATARAVFGDPVVSEGVTIVPVAKVRWGFGGGGGAGRKEDGDEANVGEGAGGGGGATASPLGFIEIRDGQAEFRRINDPAAAAPVVLAGAFAAWLVLRGLRGIFR